MTSRIKAKMKQSVWLGCEQEGEQLIHDLIKPETPLERAILKHPDWIEGALWGEPRWGHPEGKVIFHIEEVLRNVEMVAAHFPRYRRYLRLITIIHDTFKYKEEQTRPRIDWSKHHAVFAARFAEQFIEDRSLVDIIELHDEAYYAWIHAHFHDDGLLAQHRLDKVFQRIGADLQLFYLFFKCDTKTGDKTQLPIEWFEQQVPHLEIVDF